jgi:ATP/maltotriose-dependent transcriptional regulator MalT
MPEPGIALLWLAKNDIAAAVAASRRATAEARDHLTRASLLAAHCEIMLAGGDGPEARTAAEELARLAAELGAPFLDAAAHRAAGAVLLAEGRASDALPELRDAWATWQDLRAPYEAARTRVLIGLARRAIGDEEGAALELDAALWALRSLSATPDAIHVESLLGRRAHVAGGLTAREIDVLRLISGGYTNRQIAAELVISDKTVARHVSNIFAKLDVSSRTAAAAFAYRHNLISGRENG